jgi:hypothetical protein
MNRDKKYITTLMKGENYMATQKKVPIGCPVDRETYDWLQAVRSRLQKDSVGNVSLAAVIKDILKRAREDEIYGDIRV